MNGKGSESFDNDALITNHMVCLWEYSHSFTFKWFFYSWSGCNLLSESLVVHACHSFALISHLKSEDLFSFFSTGFFEFLTNSFHPISFCFLWQDWVSI